MSISKSYAVFGLGRYGKAVAEELIKNGAEVLAVDKNEALVNNAVETIPFCRCADVTDPAVIKQLGISNMDVVVISMAHNLEASVISTILCKEAGVETVIVKCMDETQRKVLSRIGADKVVLPESESGTRLGKNLLSSGFVDVIELSEDVSLVEIPVHSDWIGKSLVELDLRKKYSINVVAIKQGTEVFVDVDPIKPLGKEMTLIVITNREKLLKLN